MSRLSIKAKVTLWYTALMTVLVLLLLGLILSMGETAAESLANQQLEETVHHAMEEVEYEGGVLVLGEDVQLYSEGTYLLFYDQNYTFLAGRWPADFPDQLSASEGAFRRIGAGHSAYYVYDRYLSTGERTGVWIRGIYASNGAEKLVRNVVWISLIALPLFVVLSVLGGWQIARRAFRPVEELSRQAEQISEGKDLSQRLALKEGRDEIHQLAQTLDHMFDRLEQSFEAEQQFTYNISHELRTPIAVILAECEFALSDGTQEEQREALEVVQRQATRMSTMAEELLVLARLERNEFQIPMEETDLSELIQLVCEEQEELLPEGMRLERDLSPVTAWVNRDMLIRLTINLVSNALRYGTSWVKVTLRREREQILLSVADNGPGISPADQEKIFRRFYQVDPSRGRKQSGSVGLGLALAQQIVRLHQGTITVQSAPGEGSVFLVTLPYNNGKE